MAELLREKIMESARPMNGAECIESLRDGREVNIYGERDKDVTTRPAFRNTARMIARLYNAPFDPKCKGQIVAADRSEIT
jgi:4-hydroxyphenylacetate 3-monooxygenase